MFEKEKIATVVVKNRKAAADWLLSPSQPGVGAEKLFGKVFPKFSII